VADTIVRGRSGWIALVAVCAGALGLAVFGGPRLDPMSPPGSSYNVQPDGIAAYAELLEAFGYTTLRDRIPIAERPIPPDDTIVLLAADEISPEDRIALSDFVERGGRLIVSGSVAGLGFDRPTEVTGTGPIHSLRFPHPDVNGVTDIAVPGESGFSNWGGTLPLFSDAGAAAVVVTQVGSGTVFVLADPGILSNAVLDQAHNAALGLGMAGATGRRVHFIEYVYGYRPAVGVGAITGRWRVALLVGAVAAGLWFLAHARRLGPAEAPAGVGTRPPRSAYVDALAVGLAGAKDRSGALDGLRARIRHQVAIRTGLDPDATADAARAAATELSLDPADLALALSPRHTDAEVLAVGRVLSDLTKSR
jgi:hypothetical protein